MLLAPLRYWKVRHPVKRRWDGLLPGLGSAVLTGVLIGWPGMASPYLAGGFLAGLQGLYPILGGFFVAALTLLSTAQSSSLSQPLSGTPPVTFGNETAPLERRRFLCLLFGYLAFSCFSLYAIGFSASLMAPGVRAYVHGTTARRLISGGFLIAYNFWLTHVFISTLVGLYYFTDRLQRPDPELIRDVKVWPAE